jgi:hypothetical protein
MEKEIGLFPLNLVVFPDETVNLHIFEDRYKQLVNDCIEKACSFGIPSYVLNKIEYGTEVKITEVVKKYDDGRMDIRVMGLSVIRVLDFQNPWKDRLYAGGLIEWIPSDNREDPDIKLKLMDLAKELFEWLKMDHKLEIDDIKEVVDFVHKIGLRIEEEYDLLKMETEIERHKYLIEHLKRIIPALERAEKAKEKIRMNGHFKHLDPLKF